MHDWNKKNKRAAKLTPTEIFFSKASWFRVVNRRHPLTGARTCPLGIEERILNSIDFIYKNDELTRWRVILCIFHLYSSIAINYGEELPPPQNCPHASSLTLCTTRTENLSFFIQLLIIYELFSIKCSKCTPRYSDLVTPRAKSLPE